MFRINEGCNTGHDACRHYNNPEKIALNQNVPIEDVLKLILTQITDIKTQNSHFEKVKIFNYFDHKLLRFKSTLQVINHYYNK